MSLVDHRRFDISGARLYRICCIIAHVRAGIDPRQPPRAASPMPPPHRPERTRQQPMKLAKVKKVPADVQALNTLREAIIAGRIEQGSRITELELSESMAVSRATVRSALQQLAAEGLTVLKRYAGWTVLTLSAADVWELYTLRSAHERLAARIIAERMDDPMRARIEKALAGLLRTCETGDWVKISEADFQFHKQLVNLSENKRLIAQYALIEPQIRMYIVAIDRLIAEIDITTRQHKDIARVIMSGDVDAAGDIAEAHNLTDGKLFYDHLSAIPPQA